MALKRISMLSVLRSSPSVLQKQQRWLTNVFENDYQRPSTPKFDYLTHGWYHWLFMDRATKRINDNTKIFATAGCVLSGKSHFAKKIAEAFDMMFHDDVSDADLFSYKCPDGQSIDLREHNVVLPDSAKYFTTEMFWQDAHLKDHGKPLWLQHLYYLHRYYQYAHGMCHLFNTGRGQMFSRDVFAEVIFAEAMLKCGMMSEAAYDWFERMHNRSTWYFWRPHIIFYVKATNAQIKDRIKERNLPWELNSPTLNDKFLDAHREVLETYLDKVSKFSEILVIDRRDVDIYNDDDVRVIVDKLPRLDLINLQANRDDSKFIDWRLGMTKPAAISQCRSRFSSARIMFEQVFGSLAVPVSLAEGRYNATAREYQRYVKRRDPRFTFMHDMNPMFRNPLSIAFNPLGPNRNFKRDWPKITMFEE